MHRTLRDGAMQSWKGADRVPGAVPRLFRHTWHTCRPWDG